MLWFINVSIAQKHSLVCPNELLENRMNVNSRSIVIYPLVGHSVISLLRQNKGWMFYCLYRSFPNLNSHSSNEDVG